VDGVASFSIGPYRKQKEKNSLLINDVVKSCDPLGYVDCSVGQGPQGKVIILQLIF